MFKIFLTFGNNRFHSALSRITEQVKKLNIFDTIICYDENSLKECKDFWDKHGMFITSNYIGFGYWLWKSYLISKTLNDMKDGDILFYADAGCEINYKAHNKMIEHINKLNDVEFMATTCGHKEIQFTKRDLLIRLDADKHEYLNSLQVQGGIFLLKKSEKTNLLINEWYKVCENYKNIDDTPSINQNYKEFDTHKHDQSVISILCKKYNMVNFDLDPTYFNQTCDYNVVKNYPIIAARNPSQDSIFNELNDE